MIQVLDWFAADPYRFGGLLLFMVVLGYVVRGDV